MHIGIHSFIMVYFTLYTLNRIIFHICSNHVSYTLSLIFAWSLLQFIMTPGPYLSCSMTRPGICPSRSVTGPETCLWRVQSLSWCVMGPEPCLSRSVMSPKPVSHGLWGEGGGQISAPKHFNTPFRSCSTKILCYKK